MTAPRSFDRIDVHRLRVPLVTPYRLAFGPVEHFDTIVVEITGSDGEVGLGEATVLTGYTDETIDGSWAIARELGASLVAMDTASAMQRIVAAGREFPFTATAFGTAIEMLGDSPLLKVSEPTRVPLLGLLHGEQEAEIAREFEALLAAGFRTIKVKIGFDAERDAGRVRAVQRVVAGRARIRLDANQGYRVADAVAFVRDLDPADIELFEQPCAAGDWDAHLAVVRAAGVPMMLDESIYGVADIERAAELHAARYVKVKLMKLVTLDALAAAIARIRALGMKPVLGNGVACDLGCWMEACVAAHTIDNAGEMNGFLKARGDVLDAPLRFEDGAIVLAPGFAPRLDRDGLARFRVATAGFTPSGVLATGAAAA
jgi:L-alanine-DL-glutamate epimerase-like enolase superfamily enzyme